jgi:hypothetical protein
MALADRFSGSFGVAMFSFSQESRSPNVADAASTVTIDTFFQFVLFFFMTSIINCFLELKYLPDVARQNGFSQSNRPFSELRMKQDEILFILISNKLTSGFEGSIL